MRVEFYLAQFGLMPRFKAGIHSGNVMVGEVGQLKREKVYSGDVLNTTARIQGQCKARNADLLISGRLADQVQFGEVFSLDWLGKVNLRGKNSDIRLYRVEKREIMPESRQVMIKTISDLFLIKTKPA